MYNIYISPLVDVCAAWGCLLEHLAVVAQDYPTFTLIIGGDVNARISYHNVIDDQTLEPNSNVFYSRDLLDMTLHKSTNELI